MNYNPVVRNFCRIRRILMETLDLPREAIRPWRTFARLVPLSERRRVWERSRQDNLDVEPLTFSGGQCLTVIVVMATSALIGYSLWSEICFAACVCPIVAGIAAAWLVGRCANGIDDSYTIGDAALSMTTIPQCQDAEYRFNTNEILLKVQRVVAVSAGVDRDEITRDTSFSEDLGLE